MLARVFGLSVKAGAGVLLYSGHAKAESDDNIQNNEFLSIKSWLLYKCFNRELSFRDMLSRPMIMFEVLLLGIPSAIAVMGSLSLFHKQQTRFRLRYFTQVLNISLNELKVKNLNSNKIELLNKQTGLLNQFNYKQDQSCYTFRWRTLIEKPVREIILDEHGISRLMAAADRTTVENPFIDLGSEKDNWTCLNQVLNAYKYNIFSQFHTKS
eukprot:UN27919